MSDALVILWWGRELRLLRGDRISGRTLEEREDPAAAILRLAAADGAGARAVRLVYHPAELEAHAVACPRTGRSRLRKIFAEEHRVLAAADTVWGAEPIRGGPHGNTTVLYLDGHSPLPKLAEELAARGLRVEGAWPLQSVIEAFPTCGPAPRGFLSVLASERQAFVSSVGAAGNRSVRFYDGPEFAEAAVAEIRTVLARFDEGDPPPGLLLLEEGPASGAFREALRSQPMTEVLAAELLAQARCLAPGGLSDFLPQKPFRPWRLLRRRATKPRLAAALAAALVIGVAWRGWSGHRQRLREERQAATRREERLSLERSAASSRATHEKVEQLDEALRHAQSPWQAHYEFLRTLAQTIPATIALQTLTIEQGRFTVAGQVYEGAGAPDGPLPRFWRALGAPEVPWILSALPVKMTGAEFALDGSFRIPPAAVAAPGIGDADAIAEREGVLARALGQLPTARAFDAQAPEWSQNWTISHRSVVPFPGLEVRRYGLALDRSTSWSQLMETIKAFCAEPGLTIDRLELVAVPDGSGDFRQAEIELTVRLEP